MEFVQGQLDATTVKIEELRGEADRLSTELAELEVRRSRLEKRRLGLISDAVARADELYRSGSVETLDLLFSSKDVSQLADRAALLSRLSKEDAAVFVRLSRTRAALEVVDEELVAREREVARVRQLLATENERLQEQFRSVAAEYQELRSKLARRAPAPAARGRTRGADSSIDVKVKGDMTCPVAGPVSFTDTWGEARSGGRSHEGTDMMADYGTPLVAIVSGTITYSEFNGSGGYMVFMDGDDGNAYWYVHNQENLVSVGQRVKVGEQIATVGDTGNAAGTPHVHFEFHPGGGGPTNPYPLVSSLC